VREKKKEGERFPTRGKKEGRIGVPDSEREIKIFCRKRKKKIQGGEEILLEEGGVASRTTPRDVGKSLFLEVRIIKLANIYQEGPACGL